MYNLGRKTSLICYRRRMFRDEYSSLLWKQRICSRRRDRFDRTVKTHGEKNKKIAFVHDVAGGAETTNELFKRLLRNLSLLLERSTRIYNAKRTDGFVFSFLEAKTSMKTLSVSPAARAPLYATLSSLQANVRAKVPMNY